MACTGLKQCQYLLRLDNMPHYLFSLDEAQVSTGRIAQHWFERWVTRVWSELKQSKVVGSYACAAGPPRGPRIAS